MSEGPIKSWRDSWKPEAVSTTDVARVCMVREAGVKAYCGRKPKRGHRTATWSDVTCTDCVAARAADDMARGER